MARPMVRTVCASPSTVEAVKRLFGSFANAYARLRAAGTLPKSISSTLFGRAMRLELVEPEHAKLIDAAWSQWSEKYLTRIVP